MARVHYASFKNFYSIWSKFTAWITVYIFVMDRKHLVMPAQCLPSYQLASSPLRQQLTSIVTWSLPYINLQALYIYWIILRRWLLNDTCKETIFNILCIPFLRFILPAILPPKWNSVPQFMIVTLFHAGIDDTLIQLKPHSHTGHVKLFLLHRDTFTSGNICCPSLIGAPRCSTDCHVGCLSWLPFTSHSFNTVTVSY
jgi:hypothetical protein